MAHFSAFFTAIFLLICALLIEQLAMAQSYGQLLGSEDGPDYENPRSRQRSGASSPRNGGLSQEENAADDDTEENDSGEGFSALDRVSDPDNDEGGDTGEKGSDRGDEYNDDESDEENMESLFFSNANPTTTQQPRPTRRYSGLEGRGQENLPAYGQGYRLLGHKKANNHLLNSNPYDEHSTKMPTLQEKNEEYDDENEEDGDDSAVDDGDDQSRDTTADSPSSYHHQKDHSLLESSSDDYDDAKYSQTDAKAPDTLVTVQEGNSKQGNFRWRIVQSMNKPN